MKFVQVLYWVYALTLPRDFLVISRIRLLSGVKGDF